MKKLSRAQQDETELLYITSGGVSRPMSPSRFPAGVPDTETDIVVRSIDIRRD